MNAAMKVEQYGMETCADCMKYRRARTVRRLRRLFARLGALALAIVVATVILFGQRWLLEKGPAAVVELGMAARAAEATSSN
jgi:hypothetical protein